MRPPRNEVWVRKGRAEVQDRNAGALHVKRAEKKGESKADGEAALWELSEHERETGHLCHHAQKSGRMRTENWWLNLATKQWSADKNVWQLSLLGEGQPFFVEFANFHIENTPTMADFKLLMGCHWMLSLEEMCTVVSQEAEPAGTAPAVEYPWYPLSHKTLVLASKRKPPDQAGTCHGRTCITQTEPTNVYLINQHSVTGDSSITSLEALRTQSWSPDSCWPLKKVHSNSKKL